MEIAKNVYKIKGNSNAYLILEPIPMIIDTGTPYEREMIKDKINKIISIEKIKVVILTHLHYDHSGNLDLFKNAEFYASREEIKDFKQSPENFYLKGLSKKTEYILENKLKPIPNKILNLNIIKVPGHTIGCIALLDKKRKLLYSGDTLFENAIGRTDLLNSVPEKMKESLQKLINLIDRYSLELCPGHDY